MPAAIITENLILLDVEQGKQGVLDGLQVLKVEPASGDACAAGRRYALEWVVLSFSF
jgi:hypothetical protein